MRKIGRQGKGPQRSLEVRFDQCSGPGGVFVRELDDGGRDPAPSVPAQIGAARISLCTLRRWSARGSRA
jgi:hypothetical protein